MRPVLLRGTDETRVSMSFKTYLECAISDINKPSLLLLCPREPTSMPGGVLLCTLYNDRPKYKGI